MSKRGPNNLTLSKAQEQYAQLLLQRHLSDPSQFLACYDEALEYSERLIYVDDHRLFDPAKFFRLAGLADVTAVNESDVRRLLREYACRMRDARNTHPIRTVRSV